MQLFIFKWVTIWSWNHQWRRSNTRAHTCQHTDTNSRWVCGDALSLFLGCVGAQQVLWGSFLSIFKKKLQIFFFSTIRPSDKNPNNFSQKNLFYLDHRRQADLKSRHSPPAQQIDSHSWNFLNGGFTSQFKNVILLLAFFIYLFLLMNIYFMQLFSSEM